MAKILLEGMQFYAYHGHFAEEQKVGTKFELSLSIEVDIERASQTDNLDDTLNYLSVYQLIKEEMEINSHLIEHVAKRICKKLLSVFPQIENIELKLSKLNPPLGGQVERVSILLQERRSDNP
jgi:dihydroneopterin aldolase